MGRITEQRQQQTLNYILSYASENGRTPTFDEIQKNCGQCSKGSVANDIRMLTKQGLIDQEPVNGRIVIKNMDSSHRHLVPYIGRFYTKSSSTILEDVVGTYVLPDALFGHTERQFLFRATGDSMVEKRIYDGDILCVDRAKTATDGDIVIAFVDNKATCKILATGTDGKKYLKAANRAEDPYGNRIFDVHPESGFKILGIVRNIIIRL